MWLDRKKDRKKGDRTPKTKSPVPFFSERSKHVRGGQPRKLLALDPLHEVGAGGAELGIRRELIKQGIGVQEHWCPGRQVREDHGPSR
jgi:hypothetical protein